MFVVVFLTIAVYKPSGYRGIPCAVLLVDGVVEYVGTPLETFRSVLEQVVESLSSGSSATGSSWQSREE